MKRGMTGALVALLLLAGCGKKPLSQQPGYGDAHYSAQLYCSMTVNAGMYSDEMTRCINETTAAYMKGEDGYKKP
jgi:major membrane immunogen (membrane-anchored lipoprotein)